MSRRLSSNAPPVLLNRFADDLEVRQGDFRQIRRNMFGASPRSPFSSYTPPACAAGVVVSENGFVGWSSIDAYGFILRKMEEEGFQKPPVAEVIYFIEFLNDKEEASFSEIVTRLRCEAQYARIAA